MAKEFTREEVAELKQKYPKGTVIECIEMNDIHAIPKGTLGTVKSVDDVGTIHMSWANGSTLGLIVGEDEFEIKPQLRKEDVFMSIMDINRTMIYSDDFKIEIEDIMQGFEKALYSDTVNYFKNRWDKDLEKSRFQDWLENNDKEKIINKVSQAYQKAKIKVEALEIYREKKDVYEDVKCLFEFTQQNENMSVEEKCEEYAFLMQRLLTVLDKEQALYNEYDLDVTTLYETIYDTKNTLEDRNLKIASVHLSEAEIDEIVSNVYELTSDMDFDDYGTEEELRIELKDILTNGNSEEKLKVFENVYDCFDTEKDNAFKCLSLLAHMQKLTEQSELDNGLDPVDYFVELEKSLELKHEEIEISHDEYDDFEIEM